MKTKRVLVLPYDKKWESCFQKLKSALAEALSGWPVTIEHIGSTSVPGLSAKPILDVDIVLNAGTSFSDVKKRLEEAGYRHEGDLGISGREAFHYDGMPGPMKHHLYVCAEDSPELKRHLAFRDHLRACPADRDRYSRIKTEAALAYPWDIDGYMLAKAPLIQEIYAKLGLE